jgi:hypothetical protein
MTSSNALLRPKVSPLRQLAMSPTIAIASMGKKENFFDEGMFLLVRLGLVKGQWCSDELDNKHNNLMMWKHFEGTKYRMGCCCVRFVRALV